jgi:hypothetical protein
MYGLESVTNLTSLDKQYIWNALKGGGDEGYNKAMNTIRYFILRARTNTQRCYEIYTIDVDPEVSVDEITSMFESDPQGSAELIRSRGNLLHSDRSDRKQVIS